MGIFNTPRTQGLNSTTFVQPLHDSASNFPALYDWQGEHSPNHPLFIFGNSPGSKRIITWAEAVQGIHRASRYARSSLGFLREGTKPFIAVLATSGKVIVNFAS